MTAVKVSGEAVGNVMLPATSFNMDRFGGDSVMVWGGISMEGRTCNGCMPVRAVCKPRSPDLKKRRSSE